MTQDQLVRLQDVLHAVMAVRRQGRTPVLQRLEQIEPDLAEFFMEELSAIHALVLALGGKARLERRIIHRVEALGLVLVMALREAQLRLWEDGTLGSKLTRPHASPEPKQVDPQGPPPAAD